MHAGEFLVIVVAVLVEVTDVVRSSVSWRSCPANAVGDMLMLGDVVMLDVCFVGQARLCG